MKNVSALMLVATVSCSALATPAHAASPRTQRAVAVVRQAARSSAATAGVATTALGLGLLGYGFAKLNHDVMLPQDFVRGFVATLVSYPVTVAGLDIMSTRAAKAQFKRFGGWLRSSSR